MFNFLIRQNSFSIIINVNIFYYFCAKHFYTTDKTTMNRRIITLCTALSIFCGIQASTPDVRFKNEASDTTRINSILIEAEQNVGNARPEARVAYIAKMFLGKPYVAGTLEGEPEQLTINLDELDCTTFVENVAAFAFTLGEGRTSWRDFVYNLKRIRYAGGEINGYGSRLHYISAWILDNSHRGNLKEATYDFDSPDYIVKTLDYISTHKDKYPALADSANLAELKNLEFGYRNHRYPYIKSARVGGKVVTSELRNGDIIAITTKTAGLDVQHMGIVSVDADGVPHLMHASSAAGKVVVESASLADYFRKNYTATGIRIIRLCE
jgi:hypothetical protein